jgi:murein DD-endopeptidase MepM/ murein hydrolase activator NlpD
MMLAPRTWLFLSAAAGLTACASNPPREPVVIDYRAAAPGAIETRRAPVPQVFADTTRPPLVASPPHAPSDEPAPYEIVADLGASAGTSAIVETRSAAPEPGKRPGGARRLPADNPEARAIQVQHSDTLYDISRRYSVNMRALIETNSLEPPYALTPGRVVYLPEPNIHVIEPGETLYSVSRRYNVDTRSLALLNGIGRPWTVYPGDELLLPPLARDQSRALPTPVAVISPAQAPPVLLPPPAKPVPPKPAPPRSSASVAATTGPVGLAPEGVKAAPRSAPQSAPPVASQVVAQAPPKQVRSGPAGSREFVWPVSGKVVKDYGASGDGQRNDGVNISATKGEQVKAAAGGEVVYAGSELAGFGNLVLIRHPGGWVTAYAHSDTLLVREGDLVRQGQPIATVGSTGNAGAPQVHFELRKGKEPVDPSLHLPAMQG